MPPRFQGLHVYFDNVYVVGYYVHVGAGTGYVHIPIYNIYIGREQWNVQIDIYIYIYMYVMTNHTCTTARYMFYVWHHMIIVETLLSANNIGITTLVSHPF